MTRSVVRVVAVLASLAWCFASAASALGSGWSVQRSPNPPGAIGTGLRGVSCPSPRVCVAVGSYESSSVGPDSQSVVELAERWNGSRWSIDPVPSLPGARDTLFGVSCASATACTAVGYYEGGGALQAPLVVRWDGSSWTIQPAPATGGFLDSVSCPSTTMCVAVGNNGEFPMAERWNGRRWSIENMPFDSSAGYNSLDSVSCASPTACTAVGIETADGDTPVVEHWDGRSWSEQPTPSLTGASLSLGAVSCPSPSDCYAVGNSYGLASHIQTAVVEHWDGVSWSIEPTPTIAGLGGLASLSCVSPTACAAVGYGVAASWNGSTWSVQPIPGAAGSTDLAGVSCISPSACTAVGTNVERWNGMNWSVQRSPTGLARLLGVSCLSPSACVAVGSYGNTLPFVQRWNRARWTIERAPHGLGPLSSVSCTSPSDCSAVGSELDTVTLIERRTADGWSSQPAPSPGGLVSVSCPAGRDCMAVGTFQLCGDCGYAPHGPFMLADRWDGTRWSAQSPFTIAGETDGRLSGVSCSSTTACTAVGTNPEGSTLAERWGGGRWSKQQTPSPRGASASNLTAVSCASKTTCTAVGSYTADGHHTTLVERWDSGRWSIQPTPSPALARHSQLTAVSCPSTTACTVVGSYDTPAGNERALIERWNGTRWLIQSAPSPKHAWNVSLAAISCADPTVCTLVGAYSSPDRLESTLVERWNGNQ
jgi:hypothetical protein